MKKTFLGIFVGSLGGFFAFALCYFAFLENHSNDFSPTTSVPKQTVSVPVVANTVAEPINFEYAADQAVNAVVHVWTERIGQQTNDAWSYFFGRPAQPKVSISSGSGVIVTNDGFIVTNHHVIDGASKIKVKLNNGESKDATLIGKDPSTDLALLKIEGEDFPSLPYGNSDDIKVGQWVLAVGNPFNLSSTVTAGIVSAKARNINLLEQSAARQFPIESFIQTDAAVNPGNSGGALVGINGELLGVNTAIASNTGSYAGYSFAVPVNLVKKVVSDLYEFGTVQRAFIGVNIRNLDESLVNNLELDDYNGVYVAGVIENGAAKKAGLESEDIIKTINNVAVNNVTELQEQIGRYRPGDAIKVGINRKGKQLEKQLVLRNQSGGTELNTMPSTNTISKVYGANLRTASPDELNKLSIGNGVVVEHISASILEKSGIKEGFIITKIDKQAVATPEDVKELLSNKKSGALIEGYYANGYKAYYGFGM